LQAHPHLAFQSAIKLRRLGGMQQLLLSDLSRLIVKDHNLLKPRMEITAYNPHGWLLPGSSAFFAKTDYPLGANLVMRSSEEPSDESRDPYTARTACCFLPNRGSSTTLGC